MMEWMEATMPWIQIGDICLNVTNICSIDVDNKEILMNNGRKYEFDNVDALWNAIFGHDYQQKY